MHWILLTALALIILGLLDNYLYRKQSPFYFHSGIPVFERTGRFSRYSGIHALEESINEQRLVGNKNKDCTAISESKIILFEKDLFKSGLRLPFASFLSGMIIIDEIENRVDVTGRLKLYTVLSYVFLLSLIIVSFQNIGSHHSMASAIKPLFYGLIIFLYYIPKRIIEEQRILKKVCLFLDKELAIQPLNDLNE